MNIFETVGETTNKATDIGERYLKTSHQYYKLKIFQQISMSLTLIAKTLLIGGFLFVGLIFMSIAGAFYFGGLTDSYMLGFVIIGAIYLIVGIIVYLLRLHISKKVISIVGSKFFIK